MKIAIFISALSGGGAERVVCNLSNFLAGRGHKVDILTVGEAQPAEPLNEGVKEIRLLSDKERGITVIDVAKRVFRLCRYMRRERVDAYLVFLPRPTSLMLSLSFLTKAPIIMSERSDPKVYSEKTKKRLLRACKKADGAIFQTEETKFWYAPSLKKTKSTVIPNAINPAFIRPPYDRVREKVIVGVGRLNAQKNFALLISSFARIADSFPEYKLRIYGKGSLLEELRALAAEKGVGERVEFPGFCSDMPKQLEKASMFVLSSDYEGMPNALMEAMASGLPCVSTDCGGGGARFLINDKENGILVPIRDESALASAMESVLADASLAQKLGSNARSLQQTLAPSVIYGRWESFIEEIVKSEK